MNIKDPVVSIVMPAYNAEKYLREAIESILSQTFTDFEFIIINDGSTDRTKEIIFSYDDPRIVYIENERNFGICITLNKGLDAARGRYIARMDSDDISLPNRLAKQVAFMEANPYIGVAGSNIEIFYVDNHTPNYIFEFDADPLVCRANLIFSAALAHPTAIIRKSVLEDNHLRYDDYYRGMEDHHLWWQIAKHADITNITEVLLRYRQHYSQVTKQSPNSEFKARLRSFIRQRVCDYGAVLSNDEFEAFCLYHEDQTAFDVEILRYLIEACSKIIKQLKKHHRTLAKAQRLVFGKAISYACDRSHIDSKEALQYQFSAVRKGTMPLTWFVKRIAPPPPHYLGDNQLFVNNTHKRYKRKRLAFLMYYMNCGGVEAALVNLLNRLNYNECIVDLYLLDACGEFLNRINKQVNIIDLTTMLHPMQKQLIITQNIYRVLDFALKNNYLLRAIKYCLLYASYKILKSEMPGFRAASVSKELVDIRYDAVFDFHGYASFTSFFGAYILKGSKKFTWCHSQNIIFDKTLKCIGKYTRMFAVSSEIKELLEQQTIRIPIDVFYNFIDIERIISDAKLGDKLNRPNDSMTLLTVGRLSPQKGYDRAIEVADILRKTGLNFKWHFCGDGDDKEQLSTLVKQYNIQDHIVFMGYQNNPYGFMASCDIYVQPSRWEGYAVTLMEAVTLHKVIVTTDVSGAKEAVIDGVNGFICNQDKNELALKIEMLMTDKQLMKTMKTNALNHNLSQLSSESKLQEVLGII